MYFIKTPDILKRIYPNQVWSLPSSENEIYLTFDDGPVPDITEWVLEQLHDFSARASFFVVGQNAERHPDLMSLILKDGHSVGNHTYKHLNGWQTSTKAYLKDVLKCSEVVRSNLFRPPYGRITRSQTRSLMGRYRLIMWDVLSGDFDPTISKEKCLKNVIQNAMPGSVIVFHDSIKAADRLRYVLPRVLEHFAARGYRFRRIGQRVSLHQNAEIQAG